MPYDSIENGIILLFGSSLPGKGCLLLKEKQAGKKRLWKVQPGRSGRGTGLS
jgi:hypothetical protein